MGFVLRGKVLGKKSFVSKRTGEVVYAVDLYDGSKVVNVSHVEETVYQDLSDGDEVAFAVRVNAFADGGRGRLIVSYLGLA